MITVEKKFHRDQTILKLEFMVLTLRGQTSVAPSVLNAFTLELDINC
jgi:hypothetical protein